MSEGQVMQTEILPSQAASVASPASTRPWLPDLVGTLAVIVVALILGSRLLGPNVSLPQDNVAIFEPFKTIAPTPIRNWILQDVVQVIYPNRAFVQRAFAAGQFPLWNPYILTGQPAAADPVMALFYPTTHFFSHLSAARALDYEMLLHLLIAATGAYAAVRVLGGKPLGGVVAAAAFAGCSTLTVWQQYGNIMTCGAWLPWLFVCFAMLPRTRHRLIWIGAGGLILGLTILANDVQWLMYDLALVGCFALWMSIDAVRGRKRRLLAPPVLDLSILIDAAAIVVLGFGVGAVQFLPEYKLATSVPRLNLHPFAFVEAFAAPREKLLTMFAPNFFGTPAVLGSEWLTKSNYPESLVFWGFFPLLIAFTAPLWRRSAAVWFLWGSVLVTLSMMFNSPTLHLYAGIPGLNALEVGRIGYLTCFAGAVLCGLTLSQIFSRPRPWLPLAVLGLLAIAARGILHVALTRFTPQPPYTIQPTQESLRWVTWITVAGIVLLAINLVPRSIVRQGAAIAFALLIVVDMVHFSLPYNAATVPESTLYPTPQVFASLPHGQVPPRAVPINAKDSDLLLPPNFLETFGISDLAADESLVSPAYGEFFRLIEPNQFKYNGYILTITSDHSPLLDLAGVEYFLSNTPLDPATKPVTLVSAAQNVFLYRNMQAAPRAFIVTDVRPQETRAAVWQALAAPGYAPCSFATVEGPSPLTKPSTGQTGCVGSATITRYEPNRVFMRADTPAEGMLVFTDAYTSDWQVTVDGVSQPMLKADGPFRGVHLMPGSHDVRFEYHPAVIYQSAVISVVASVVCVAIIALGFWWPRRRSRAGQTAATTPPAQ